MTALRATRQDFFWAGVSGLLSVLSFPNVDFFPVAWVFLVPLLLCTRGKTAKDAFLLGVFAGIVAYLGLVYWVVVAVHRYGNIPLPLAIPILILLVLYLSLYWGIFTYFCSYYTERAGCIAMLALSALWVGLEYLRSFFLTGFPWALLGYSQYRNTTFVQAADIVGVYGISFLLVLSNILLFLWLVSWRQGRRRPITATIVTAAILALTFAYGSWKIHSPLTTGEPLKVAVVQGNIEQDVKWDKRFQRETLAIYRTLSLGLREAPPRLIVWPETALPAYFPTRTELDQGVLMIPKELGSYLLFGSLSRKKGQEEGEVYNSAYLIAPSSLILDRYDKLHLVPFGEYIPLSRFFPIFSALVGIGNISSGKAAVIFHLPEGKFGVLICFEVIFPELSRKFIRKGADFMVTITNDAWFGRTSAPYQHLAHATLRCIENRTWLVRAANTGISAFIDPWGRIQKATGLFTREALTEQIGVRRGQMTFYTKHGDLFAIICSLLGTGLIGYSLIRKLKAKS